jgi:hypothetical protein
MRLYVLTHAATDQTRTIRLLDNTIYFSPKDMLRMLNAGWEIKNWRTENDQQATSQKEIDEFVEELLKKQ